MAIHLDTPLQALYFSSHFPTLVFSTDAEYIDVEISSDGAMLYAQTLYPYGHRVSVSGLATILEMAMKGGARSTMAVHIFATTEEGDEVERDVNVIFCASLPSLSAYEYVDTHFLSTRTAKILPRHELAVDYLHAIGTEPARVRKRFAVIYVRDGIARAAYIDAGEVEIGTATATVVPVRFGDVSRLLQQNTGEQEHIICFTLTLGGRSMTYYITEHQPEAMFLFANAFGCMELAPLCCTTTEKVQSPRSVAVIGERSEFYNQENSKEYCVYSAPLTDELARWLEQMWMSHCVRFIRDYALLEDDDLSSGEVVLVTDFTSEISDSDQEPSRVKFTWQYEANRPYLPLKESERGVFSQEFSQTYD